ncbi:hypothetical protein LOAG_00372 [Loa loa]|uniref:Uncharacterized protein n=1 Tax=Loa loa TaxID=7209 RepID=A0A1S0UC49_LOALO|nr:hypothetical protein LOAG_00372 [Loa loa]EFO28113.1 hypothetical protein LOAG_00372 [Loa loa]
MKSIGYNIINNETRKMQNLKEIEIHAITAEKGSVNSAPFWNNLGSGKNDWFRTGRLTCEMEGSWRDFCAQFTEHLLNSENVESKMCPKEFERVLALDLHILHLTKREDNSDVPKSYQRGPERASNIFDFIKN